MTALGGWRSKRTGRVVVGLAGLILSIGYTVEATSIPLGTQVAPGPGMFPLGVGVVAAVISVVVVLEALLTPVVTGAVELPTGSPARMVLGFAAVTGLFVLVMPFLGQYVAAVLYSTAMIKLLGTHGWARTIGYGLAMGVIVSVLFVELLEVRMPAGSLWSGIL